MACGADRRGVERDVESPVLKEPEHGEEQAVRDDPRERHWEDIGAGQW